MADVHDIRSRILNYAIMTERELEDFINIYFINNEDKREEFNDLILSKEFFTFEQKIRVFQKIVEKNGFKILNIAEREYAGGIKKFMKDIRYIQEVRNALAHKHPFRNAKTDEITIEYKYDNKMKEIPLTDDFDKSFFRLYRDIFDALRCSIRKIELK